MTWHAAYEAVLPYVFAIETPDGRGSGFFFARSENKRIIAIATAAHVVEHAEDWKTPIKLRHHTTGKELFLPDSDRLIFLDQRRDSASILFANATFELPDEPLPMIPADKVRKVGGDVGWVGYPGVVWPQLCFFTGTVSAFIGSSDYYLIDGVAINGVSGGPVFSEVEGAPQILGTVSAYIPNRVRGDALPGLMSAQDVTSFHDTVKKIRSMDEAQRARKEEEEKNAAEQQAAQQPQPDAEPDAQGDRPG